MKIKDAKDWLKKEKEICFFQIEIPTHQFLVKILPHFKFHLWSCFSPCVDFYDLFYILRHSSSRNNFFYRPICPLLQMCLCNSQRTLVEPAFWKRLNTFTLLLQKIESFDSAAFSTALIEFFTDLYMPVTIFISISITLHIIYIYI